jgi:cell wall-associated NlpC family hydrolase
MQSDGNLVIYADGGVIFSTNTANRGGNRLVMQDDGNLVMYGSSAVWASKDPGERAIHWFYNNNGRTDYEGKCELAVENAFGTSGKYRTARANWNDRVQQQPYTSAPRGSLVFYNTSADGHVAISIGNGKIYSSSVGGRLGIASISYFPNPLGWAYAPW